MSLTRRTTLHHFTYDSEVMMNTNGKGPDWSRWREWVWPALGASAAGTLFVLTVVFLMVPVVKAGRGDFATALVLLAVPGRRLVLEKARAVGKLWKAAVLALASTSFLACSDPVGVHTPETAEAIQPKLTDTIHPCRVAGGTGNGATDRLAIEQVGRC